MTRGTRGAARLLAWLASGLVTLLVLAVIAVLVVGTTETGLRLAAEQAERHLPGDLQYERLEGQLLGTVAVQGLTYRHEDEEIALAQGIFAWQPTALLGGVLRIEAVSLDGLDATLGEREPAEAPERDADPFALPDELPLPLQIELREVLLADAVIRLPDAEPIRIDALRLSARLRPQGVRLREFTATMPEGEAKLAGRIQVSEQWRTDLDIAWRLTLPDLPTLAGEGRLEGDLARMTLTQQLTGAVAGDLKLMARDLAATPRWAADLDLAEVDPGDFGVEEVGSVHGRIEAAGDLESGEYRLALETTLPEVAATELTASGTFEIAGPALTIAEGRARLPELDAELTLAGELAPDALALAGRWQGLAWPPDTQEYRSPEGTYQLTGTPEDYGFEVAADLEAPDLPPGRAELTGSGTLEAMQFERLALDWLEGTLEGSGRIAWAPVLEWEMDVDARALNPGHLAPDWPGRITASVHSSGRLAEGVATEFELRDLEGELRDQPLGGQVVGRFAEDRLVLEEVGLRYGEAELTAAGQLGEAWDLEAQLAIPSLGALLPDASGIAEAELALSGPRERPRIRAELVARELAAFEFAVATLDADVDVDLRDADASHARLAITGVEGPPERIESAELTLAGHLTEHRLDVAAVLAEATLSAAVTGGVLDPESPLDGWRGQVVAFELGAGAAGEWVLREPAALHAGPERMAIEALCLDRDGGGGACVTASRDEIGSVRTSVRAEELPAVILDPWLPQDVDVEGDAFVRLEAAYHAADDYRVDAEFAVDGARVDYHLEGIEPIGTPVDLDVTLEASPEGARSTLALTIDEGRAAGQLRIGGNPLTEDPESLDLDGRLEASYEDLGMVSLFVPEITDIRGSLEVDVSVAGTVGAPAIAGGTRLAVERAEVPAIGLLVVSAHLEAQADGSREIRLSGGVEGEEGTLEAEGALELDPQRGWPLDVRLNGDRFLAVNLPEARIWITPDLTVSIDEERLDIRGDVLVPRARLEPLELEVGVAHSDDVVVEGRDIEEPEPARPVYSRVRLVLGDDVRFEGYGLEALIRGSVEAEDEPGRPTLGRGEVRIEEGRYEAYGQDLRIERGRLVFAGGPIQDPGLDILAVRELREVTPGVEVRGTLSQPQLRLVSEPAMDQGDILAYLILGRPLSQATSGEGDMLYSAAQTAGLAGGELIAQRIGAEFGIEDVRIEEGEEPGEATLMVGRYLSPRLYVGYGVGLFEAVSVFQLQYELSRRWTLRTESGREQSADLLYTIERGD